MLSALHPHALLLCRKRLIARKKPRLNQSFLSDAAKPLQSAVQEFNAYLYREFTSNNKDFCLVTFGDDHLKRWLRADAKRKGVKLVAHYSKYLDIKAEYQRQHPKAVCPPTLPELAKKMGVTIDTGKVCDPDREEEGGGE